MFITNRTFFCFQNAGSSETGKGPVAAAAVILALEMTTSNKSVIIPDMTDMQTCPTTQTFQYRYVFYFPIQSGPGHLGPGTTINKSVIIRDMTGIQTCPTTQTFQYRYVFYSNFRAGPGNLLGPVNGHQQAGHYPRHDRLTDQ